VIFEVAPIFLPEVRSVEPRDLRRTVGDVIAVAVGAAKRVIGFAPRHIVATHDVAFVERAAVLGVEHIGDLQVVAQWRIRKPALLIVFSEPAETPSGVIAIRIGFPQLGLARDVRSGKQRETPLSDEKF
jgi:hypothetical protein